MEDTRVQVNGLESRPIIILSNDVDIPCAYSWTNKSWTVCVRCLTFTEYRLCNGEVVHVHELCERHVSNQGDHNINDIWFWQQQMANRSLFAELKASITNKPASFLLRHPKIEYIHAGGCNYSDDTYAAATVSHEVISSYLISVRDMRSQLVTFGCEDCLRKFTPPITETVLENETQTTEDLREDTHWHRIGLLKSPANTLNNDNILSTKNIANAHQLDKFSMAECPSVTPLTESSVGVSATQCSVMPTDTEACNSRANHDEPSCQASTSNEASTSSLLCQQTEPSTLIVSSHLPQLSTETMHNVPNPQLDPIIKHCKVCTNDIDHLDKELSHPPRVLSSFSKRCNMISHNINGSYLQSNISNSEDKSTSHDSEASHSFIPFHVLQQHETDMLDAAKPLFTRDTFIDKFWQHNHHLRVRNREVWEKLYFTYNSGKGCRRKKGWREPLVRHLKATGRLGTNDTLVPLHQTMRPGEYVVANTVDATLTREKGKAKHLKDTSCEREGIKYLRVKDMTDEEAWW